jgi:hypothetical protein
MEESDSSAVSFCSRSAGAEAVGEAFSSGVEVAMSGKVISAQACLLKIV